VNATVDASIAVKWYFREERREAALRLLGDEHDLIAPDLLIPEFANVAWKYVQRALATRNEARLALERLLVVPITIYATGSVMPAAFDIACETGRSAYDCTYLALALERGCRLVTADRRLYSAMQGTPYAGTMLWVEDVP
jgi:predicted nucleic acid-binding protein